MESRILIVDDEPLVLEMFETVLRDSGYVTSSAPSAAKAKDLILSENFDLIIVDVWLEDEDGFMLAQYAKKIQNKIGVVVITGRPSEKGEALAFENGFEYLSKPVPFGDLIVAVEKNLNKGEKIQAKVLERDSHSISK